VAAMVVLITGKNEARPTEPASWSFVDSVKTTTNSGHFHIRRLTTRGRQLTSTIDTPILCKPGSNYKYFFDVAVPFTEANVILGCPQCVVEYRTIKANGWDSSSSAI
jgi:hypothetical protein